MKGDLISRKAAVEALTIDRIQEETRDRYKKGVAQGLNYAIAAIEELPPAQPEVIRCRDCGYSQPMQDIELLHCSYHEARYVRPNGYCCWAVMKEEDNG